MEKFELSDEKFEEFTKGKKPLLTISYYEVEGTEDLVAHVKTEEIFLNPLDKSILKGIVIRLGALLGKIRADFLKEKGRKEEEADEEADSVKC